MLSIIRQSIVFIGETFNVQFGAIIGILIALVNVVIPFFSREEIAQSSKRFQSPEGIISTVLWGIGIVFLTVVVSQIIRAVCIFLSEKIPLSIEINDSQDLNHLVRPENEEVIIDSIAVLQIINNENYDLVNAYAVLRKAEYLEGRANIGVGTGEKRLQWKGSKDCEFTTLGSHGGESALQVYKVSYRKSLSSSFDDALKNKTQPLESSGFMICGNQLKTVDISPQVRRVIDIEIVIHAEINGKNAVSRPFYGYVFVVEKQDDPGPLYVKKGKFLEQEVSDDQKAKNKQNRNTPQKSVFRPKRTF